MDMSLGTHKKVVVIGDPMIDIWVSGEAGMSQEGCQRFLCDRETVITPGGAANAARQLFHSGDEAFLLGLCGGRPRTGTESSALASGSLLHGQVNTDWCVLEGILPTKTRFMDDNRIVFRRDVEYPRYALGVDAMAEVVRTALSAIKSINPDGVLISDYNKGLLSSETIYSIIRWCNAKGIPVVCDPRKAPSAYRGSVMKCNQDYMVAHNPGLGTDALAGLVVTRGSRPPWVADTGYPGIVLPDRPAVTCKNAVGSGDCFAAWLLWAMMRGASLEEAAGVADAAGRIYVTHEHGRPPWRHETMRELYGSGAKVLDPSSLGALRASVSGNLVFTNGVFRLPHAGHVALFDWAKRQGDVLVVAVNDAAGAARQKNGEYVLPLEQRLAMLAGMQAVDWVVPFSEDTPLAIIAALLPDVLVKGSEYTGQKISGSDLVDDVRFAPEFPSGHASDLVAQIRSAGKWNQSPP